MHEQAGGKVTNRGQDLTYQLIIDPISLKPFPATITLIFHN